MTDCFLEEDDVMKGSALNDFILPDKLLYLFLGIVLLLLAVLL